MCYVFFLEPATNYNFYHSYAWMPNGILSGNMFSAVISINATFPIGATVGLWSTCIYCRDTRNHGIQYCNQGPTYNQTINQTTAGVIPSAIISLFVTPTTVNTSQASASISASLVVANMTTPIVSCYIYFTPPSFSLDGSVQMYLLPSSDNSTLLIGS